MIVVAAACLYSFGAALVAIFVFELVFVSVATVVAGAEMHCPHYFPSLSVSSVVLVSSWTNQMLLQASFLASFDHYSDLARCTFDYLHYYYYY